MKYKRRRAKIQLKLIMRNTMPALSRQSAPHPGLQQQLLGLIMSPEVQLEGSAGGGGDGDRAFASISACWQALPAAFGLEKQAVCRVSPVLCSASL